MSTESQQLVSAWRAVGRVEDIPLRGARRVDSHVGPIAVFRTGDSELLAVDDRCPHLGGPLSEGIVHGRQVTCPLHGLKLSLETGQAIAPDAGCVRRYPVRVVQGVVYLDLVRTGVGA